MLKLSSIYKKAENIFNLKKIGSLPVEKARKHLKDSNLRFKVNLELFLLVAWLVGVFDKVRMRRMSLTKRLEYGTPMSIVV